MGGAVKELDAETFAMNILLENPSLSIDSVIREVNHSYRIGIAKEKVTRLRRRVQEMIGRGHGGGAPTPREEPEPFNPPRLVIPKEEPMEVAHKSTSTPEERRSWFSDWALDNPGSTVEAARRALNERYGLAIGTKSITDILGEARKIHADSKPQDPPAPIPVPAPLSVPNPILDLVEAAKKLGIKRLEISKDDYTVELFGKFSDTEGGSR